MVKIPCEICGIAGTLQKVGNNYYRIRHYTGVDKTTRKPRFHYHQNTKHYAEKQLEKLRETKTGAKILDPVLKPFDKADEFLAKKVYDPIKGKLTSLKHKIVKPKPKLTGWERGPLGTEGYTFKEVYGPPKEQWPGWLTPSDLVAAPGCQPTPLGVRRSVSSLPSPFASV